MATGKRDVFDLLDEKPSPAAAARPQADIFDSLTANSAPADQKAQPASQDIPTREFVPSDELAALSGTAAAPEPNKAKISASPGEFTSLFKNPIAAVKTAIADQYEASIGQLKNLFNEPGSQEEKIGKAALATLGVATSPLAPGFRVIENVGRAVVSGAPQTSSFDVRHQAEAIPPDSRKLQQENVKKIAIVSGSDRPTTGNEDADVFTDLVSGLTPLPIPVAGIMKLLRLPAKYAPAVEAVSKDLVKNGLPAEEGAIASEIAKLPIAKLDEALPAHMQAPAVTEPVRPATPPAEHPTATTPGPAIEEAVIAAPPPTHPAGTENVEAFARSNASGARYRVEGGHVYEWVVDHWKPVSAEYEGKLRDSIMKSIDSLDGRFSWDTRPPGSAKFQPDVPVAPEAALAPEPATIAPAPEPAIKKLVDVAQAAPPMPEPVTTQAQAKPKTPMEVKLPDGTVMPELVGSPGSYVSSRAPKAPQGQSPKQPVAPTRPPAAPPAKSFRSGSVLEEAERITAPAPEPGPLKSAGEKLRLVPKQVQTSLVSEFTPLRDLERNIHESAGAPAPKLDLARKFEQVAGAPAKAEADVIDFTRAVVDPIRDHADDFNTYLFLKRTENRLETDPLTKKVGDWTADKARVGLEELCGKVGDEAFNKMEAAGQAYQEEMDKALQLQVSSGRMSQEVYDRIKSSNDFYARFKVMKYITDEAGPAGTGRQIATTSDLTKAISGIDEGDLRIGNILQASAEQIVRSRILAEKNKVMLELDQLAQLDKSGEFVKPARPTRYFQIEYKPAEQILKQLGLQETAKNPQVLEQSFIKVGKAIQFADEVGLKLKQKNLPSSLGRATLGGVESGGRVNLNAFTSEVISHELGHSYDTILRDVSGRPIIKTKNVFGVQRDVPQHLSSAINEPMAINPKTGKRMIGQNEFQKELGALVDYTGLGGSPKYRASAKERFAEFLQLYIHNPAKARELAPTWTEHFEMNILPNHRVQDLVERLSKFYQKVDSLPNILTPLKELDDANYLETAIRRAFPDKKPQLGVAFGTKAKPGNEIVNYLKDGKEVALEVSKPVATAIQGLNAAQTGLITKVLASTKVPLQWGATSANAAFQVVNLLFADLPRAALISRYGVRSLEDVYRFPADWAYSLFTSMKGNFGRPNELFMDWLRSGAANSTIQRELTPGAFKATLGLKEPWKLGRVLSAPKELVLDNVAKFSNAIEETSKILGLKRGLRIEGIDKLAPEAAASKLQQIAAEVRNYSGSPDFARKGRDTTSMNLLFMFFNARMQGATADLTRLAGMTGTKEAGAAWLRLGAAVGIPATILALVNTSDKYRADYEKIPDWEKKNYFMIPRDSFFVNDNGERIREYYRVPKREIVSLFGNMIESAVDFGRKQDPKAFKSFAVDALETLSPLNIQGKTATERLESVVGSANPLVKVPIEQATGRDTFRHQNIVPDYMKQAEPTEQYRTTTPPGVVKVAKKLGISPLRLSAAIESSTGGGVTQFTPGRPEVGRSKLTKFPVLKRFVRSGSVDGEDAQADITAAEQKESTAAVIRRREALEILRQWRENNRTPAQRQKDIADIKKTDPALAKKVLTLNEEATHGITYQDKTILALGVESGARAEYIKGQLAKMNPRDSQAYLDNLRKKKILTEKVQQQLRQRRS